MSQTVPPEGRPGPDVFSPGEPRRGFVAQMTAIVIGGLVGIVPAAVGLATFLNPLRKSVKEKQRPVGSDAEGYYRVTTLESVSVVPQAYKIIADRKDAWNTFPKDAIGAVYLSLAGAGKVRAFNVTCPHAGCGVDWKAGKRAYLCPCHNSSFDADGVRDPKSPSARDLDSLDVKIVDRVVWVKYQDLKTGVKEKKPV
jgi:Rieske Fe-S protein